MGSEKGFLKLVEAEGTPRFNSPWDTAKFVVICQIDDNAATPCNTVDEAFALHPAPENNNCSRHHLVFMLGREGKDF